MRVRNFCIEHRDWVLPLAIACVFVIVAQILVFYVAQPAQFIHDKNLLDPDSYMWLNRATNIHENGQWFEHNYSRINPPQGHIQHWTRPVDAILLMGAYILKPLFGFDNGLYYTALVFGPLFHLFTLLSLAWAARPLVPREGLPLLFLIFLTQTPLWVYGLIGRPDHHILLTLFFMVTIGFLLRLMLWKHQRLYHAIGLGCILGLGVWVSLEMMVILLIALAALGICWLMGDRHLSAANLLQAIAFHLTIFAALLIEWGASIWTVREMDALAIQHVTLSLMMIGFWGSLWAVKDFASSFAKRLLISGSGAVLLLVGLWMIHPEFFASPLANVHPFYYDTRLRHIIEFLPVFTAEDGVLLSFVWMFLLAGLALVIMPYAIVRCVREKELNHKIVWFIFCTATLFFFAMTLSERRWADYLAIIVLIPYGVVATSLMGIAFKRLPVSSHALTLPIARLILIAPHIWMAAMIGVVLLSAAEPTDAAQRQPDSSAIITGECDTSELARLLSHEPAFHTLGVVMAHADLGPEILYKTPHSVLSIPNHRLQPGYLLTHKVLRNPDHNEAITYLHSRQIDFIVFCPLIENSTRVFDEDAENHEPFMDFLIHTPTLKGYRFYEDLQDTGNYYLFYKDTRVQ